MEGIKKILNPDLFDMYLDDRVISTWFKEKIERQNLIGAKN